MEIWKNIIGFEGLYLISNTGKVWSNKTNKELSQASTGRGNNYKKVNLRKEGKTYQFLVHRLVAIHFVENDNPKEKKVVNHKIAVCFGGSNDSSNLEWTTNKENIEQAGRDGRMNRTPVNEREVLQLDKDGNILNKYKSITEAANITGARASHICGICNGEKGRKTSGGYYWRYCD